MQSGQIVAGRFEILRHAGSGGMGAVYKSRDRQTGQAVALKVLHGHGAAHAERFAREAQLLSELRHPGIVRFVGSGVTAEGDGFIVMEWLEGESLAARLKRGPLSIDEVIQLGARVADALRPAHERGIVHRDLKPQNLFLEGGVIDRVRVLDFGIARVLEPGQKLTITGQMIGTPGYMSPEQARGDQGVDVRTDVYALGCVLYRALTGRRLFADDDPVSAMVKVTQEEAPRASEKRPDVPPTLDDLVARMLAISPMRRPRDAAAVLAELAVIGGFQAGETAISPSVGPRAIGPAGSFAAMAPSSFTPAPPPVSGALSQSLAHAPTAHAQPAPPPTYAPVGMIGAPPVAPGPTVPGALPMTAVSGAPSGYAAVPAPTALGAAPAGYAPPYGAAPQPAAPAAGGQRATVLVLLGAVGALLLVVLIGGAAAMWLFWPSSGGPFSGGPGAFCPGERCISVRLPDASRVDATALLPEVRKVARGIDSTAQLMMISIITSRADGTIDAKNQRQSLHYHFENARRDERFYLWVSGDRLVLNRTAAIPSQQPIPDPGCPMASIVRASGVTGGGDKTMTLVNSGPPLGAIFLVASGSTSSFVDPTSCAVRSLY